jgi:hypothetical protein
MNNFGLIRAYVKFTPLFEYKKYNNKIYKNIFAIYNYKMIGQIDRAHFSCMLSLC